MLQISKKAATEAECEHILEMAYSLRTPMGCETLIVNPAKYREEKNWLRSLFTRSANARLRDDITNMVARSMNVSAIDAAIAFSQNDGEQFLNKMMSDIALSESVQEKAPAWAAELSFTKAYVVFAVKERDAARKFIGASLGMKPQELSTFPGYDSQWNFASLAHEIGHQIDIKGEATADEFSAILCKNAFQDCTLLYTRADCRALQTVLFYDDDIILNNYGWSCVTAIDNVIGMSDFPTPPELESYIRSLPPDRHQNHANAVRNVGIRVRALLRTAFPEGASIVGAAEAAIALMKGGLIRTPAEMAIARRFAIAATRIGYGQNAYAESLTRDLHSDYKLKL